MGGPLGAPVVGEDAAGAAVAEVAVVVDDLLLLEHAETTRERQIATATGNVYVPVRQWPCSACLLVT